MSSYHNTTHVRGQELSNYIALAEDQDGKVLEFFLANPEIEATAEDIHALIMPDAPLTSARRAISNLKELGKLSADRQVQGKYGRPIHTWRLAE